MGLWYRGVSEKGCEQTSRTKIVKDWNGGEVKRVEDSDDSVAEHMWVSRSKTAIWWMSLWM